MGDIERIRAALASKNEADGLLYVMQYHADYGTFESQRAWGEFGAQDSDVLLVKFEDVIGEGNTALWEKIFTHLDIPIPPALLSRMLREHRFEALAGRKRGVEDRNNHYRKGVHGDWKNHFEPVHAAAFKKLTGDLLQRLGYETDETW